MKKIKIIKYWVQSKDEHGKEENVCHSKDDETGELYYQFLDRAKANKLIWAERKASPEYKYRVVKETKILELEPWDAVK